MRRLMKLLKDAGKEFVGVLYISGIFYFYALDPDPKKIGQKPVREFCRDDLDYKLRLRAWKRAGTYVLFAHEDFDMALSGAMDAAK